MMGLHVDFVRDGGTYMILRAEGELSSNQLNQVQKEMLLSVAVPGLLRLDIREVDYKVSLHYDITGKRMLSQCLKSDKFGMTEFYSLLLQIITVLDDSKGYMLSPLNYILEEEFIFVEEPLANGILFFTYVPMKDQLTLEPIQKKLLSLITRLITNISQIEGNGIQKIISFCSSDLFSITGLKKMLIGLLADDRLMESKGPSSMVTNMQSKYESSQVVIKEYLPSSPQTAAAKENVRFDHNFLRRNDPIVHQERESPRLFHPEDNEATEPTTESTSNSSSPKLIHFLLGIILIDALCWKFLYLDHPGSLSKYICLTLTILLAGIVLLLWSGKLPLPLNGLSKQHSKSSIGIDEEPIEEERGGRETRGQRRAREYDEKWRWNEVGDVNFPNPPKDRREPQPIGTPHSFEVPVQQSAQIPQQIWRERNEDLALEKESVLPTNPATVLLKGPAVQASYSMPQQTMDRYLERCHAGEGGAERIPLKPGSFVIGRSEEIVQYVEKTVGVSRAHVELMVTNNSCTLKDLGSKNGTKLNGELLAPYKDYPLEVGDVFSIAEVTFKYC
ncbi:DUF6382 domain-containing protein [Paenibacillus segetis]|uniref:FHA domain-containing protein n=1 Tax=Paenibacillus segetis TaxID=1325360 RepID=A0ABQ1Y590_9BACL|nr:DUF6382 domain-containing protein [Paenibacillus segetis]GGH13253.1 hypothetical protein GCM10008013_06190 [Paenibacillus segetis]